MGTLIERDLIQAAMSDAEPYLTADECTFDLVFSFMLPLFLASAGGDLSLARASIIELLDAYEASSPAEIELVSRIISLGHVAMDSLRQSMRPGLSDNLILRYRSNAIAMNRAAEQCTKTLGAMQARRAQPRRTEASRQIPPPPRPPMPQMPKPPAPPSQNPPPQPTPAMRQSFPPYPEPALSVEDIEAVNRNAQALLAQIASRLDDPGTVPPDPSFQTSQVPPNLPPFG